MGERERNGYVPARPTLTPLFTFGIAFWAACAAAYAQGQVRSASELAIVAGAGITAALIELLLAFRGKWRMVAYCAAAVAVGVSLGCVGAAQVKAAGDSLDGFSGNAELTLLEDTSSSGFGETALARMRLESGAGAIVSARFGEGQIRLAGERIACNGSFTLADYGKAPRCWMEGACGSLKVDACEAGDAGFPTGGLVDLRRRAISAFGNQDDAHMLLQALVCGYRHDIASSDLYSAFQTCGLAHIVAVSGAHLVIVTGLFASALRAMRVPRRLEIAVLIGGMVVYFVFAGMPVSALRALVMSSSGLLAFFARRRPSSLNAVGIAIFLLLTANPATCLSASFALSGLSTIGIVLFAPLFQSWFEQTPLARAGFVVEGFSLTLAAGLLSQLYACSLFSQLPLIAPFANVIAAPLFPVACGCGLVQAVACCALGSNAILGFVSALASGCLAVLVELLSRVPHASIPFSIGTVPALGFSAAAAIVLWVMWPKHGRGVCTCACCALVTVAVLSGIGGSRGDCITALDVGQGDSILVQSRGRTLLIDTGNQDSRLLEQLGRNRITHIDALLVSHADDDHCGSIDALRKAVQVDTVIVAADMVECDDGHARTLMNEAHSSASEVVGVRRGACIDVGAFRARVVWPDSFCEDGGNADSLCVVLEYDGDDDGTVDMRAFMTGDAEKDEIASMVEQGRVGDIDILKVPHHGSRNGLTVDELRVLKPEIALISCGKNNRYGHPKQETLDLLGQVGAQVFRTDQDGEIKCMLSTDSVKVDCIA